ncbi:hypothetical protein BD830_101380 [Maritimibacter alkaliphilus HTCC2654]|uniref:Tetratricopeptide repeat protein n=1 Tax=Maritimibacter alkaliphilus HTCC2654 TaxID=314271 RepID=A3VHV2_9RHOB|nr:hypothetical protein [Maritimibacter alkaliphilus]EAQ12293.1 hypothetical protein RB2654_08807 [Rhodobacterales bacterium HTCC2654] [Maritimibacter alkaliphilus HTCC2654]TYP85420.1 hypothetical protein BD830_101380 [Maritimibacter alkaliphilus HTCC2654]
MEYADLVETILKRGNLTLTPDEAAVLETAPDDYLPARRILGAHAFNTGDTAKAVEITRAVYELEPNRENASNLISALTRANLVDEALAVASDDRTPIPDVLRASYMSELNGRKGNLEENRRWSIRALELKETEAPVLGDRPAPVVHRFDPERPERNIISYSLWGNGARYLEGAVRNAIVARYVYPGWTPRFYIDESVPEAARKELRANGAQLRMVPSLPANRYGLFWRFLVEDDRDVDIYVCRDADSVPTIRERVAVQDWLNSGQPFHVMRDFLTHSELILAGLWGAHRGNIPGMGKRILAFAKSREKVLNSRVDDQLFLRREVWPWMRDRVFVQDSAFGYGESAPFSPDYPLPGRMHVGQDDYAHREAQAQLRAVKAAGYRVRRKDADG